MPSFGDQLSQMAEWVRTTPVVEFALWVSGTPFCLWLQDHFFAIPTFQALHILAIAILFNSTLMPNLRILGLNGEDQSMIEAYRRYQPWIWCGLVALIASGTVLLISEPVRNMVNPIFWTKLVALLLTIRLSSSSSAKGRADCTIADYTLCT